MQEELRELIAKIINNLDVEKLDKRIDSFVDFKSPYVVLKPSVKVEVELTNGKKFVIDITDYFEGVVK